MRVIEADGVTLEPQVAAHAEAMFGLLADPDLYRYTEDAPPESVDRLRNRYAMLESRRSADGTQHWLNWVLRLPGGEIAGYVQATVFPAGRADIAYVLGTAHQGRGLARRAVSAMIDELILNYAATTLTAVVARRNLRSLHLLNHLGFTEAPAPLRARRRIAEDDCLMWREVDTAEPRAAAR